VDRVSVAYALAALGDSAAVPALVEALDDPNDVSLGVVLALGRLGDATAVQPLVAVLQDHQNFWVLRGAAAVALGMMGATAEPALEALAEALEYDVNSSGEKWHQLARDAVEDAIRRINDPQLDSSLRGHGYRYEMWGITVRLPLLILPDHPKGNSGAGFNGRNPPDHATAHRAFGSGQAWFYPNHVQNEAVLWRSR
jgi:hypothetical protein